MEIHHNTGFGEEIPIKIVKEGKTPTKINFFVWQQVQNAQIWCHWCSSFIFKRYNYLLTHPSIPLFWLKVIKLTIKFLRVDVVVIRIIKCIHYYYTWFFSFEKVHVFQIMCSLAFAFHLQRWPTGTITCYVDSSCIHKSWTIKVQTWYFEILHLGGYLYSLVIGKLPSSPMEGRGYLQFDTICFIIASCNMHTLAIFVQESCSKTTEFTVVTHTYLCIVLCTGTWK